MLTKTQHTCRKLSLTQTVLMENHKTKPWSKKG